MPKISYGVESTAESVLPVERTEYCVYLRSNITRVDEQDTEEMPGKHCWVYDEEELTLTEYIDRLEAQAKKHDEDIVDAIEGIAEVYEMLYDKEVV